VKTKAAVLYRLNTPLVIETLPIPPLTPGQVLVKMLASGICRSQLNEIKGFKGTDVFLPHLLGHEGSGIVYSVGSGVTKVKQGDYVVLTWIEGRGLSVQGAVYRLGNKTIGSGPITTFATHTIVSENRIVKIAKKIPAPVAALLGCAVTTGMGIVRHHLRARPNTSIIVFGIGGVGASSILGARFAGCKTIIAVDIRKEALTFSRTLGATHTILFHEATLMQAVKKFCPRGCDYAIEASGNKQAMEKAIEATKDAGQVVIAGNLRRGDKICLDPFVLIKGKRLEGTWGGETQPDVDIPFYAKAYRDGTLDLDKLIGRRFTLGEINTALTLLETNKHYGRMIIEFT